MRVEQVAVLVLEVERGTNMPIAALLQMGLEKQSLYLAAFGLPLALNLVEGKLQGVAGSQPGLEKSEIDSGGRSRERSRGCD